MTSEPEVEIGSDAAVAPAVAEALTQSPRIYRAMEADSGVPVIGTTRNQLGARVAPAKPCDITPDSDGNVVPGGGGISVNPSLSMMMMVHVPSRWRELDPKFKSARGEEPVEVFRMGEGEFGKGNVAADLLMIPDSPKHGVVEPDHKMSEADYQKALAATQHHWQLLHTPDGS